MTQQPTTMQCPTCRGWSVKAPPAMSSDEIINCPSCSASHSFGEVLTAHQ